MTALNQKVMLFALLLIIILSLFIFLSNNLNKPKNKLAEGFPQTPVYPQAKLIESGKDSREGVVYSASWEVKDEIPSLVVWYIDEFQNSGWTLISPPSDMKVVDIQYLVLTKDKYILNLSLIRNKENTQTNIIIDYIDKNMIQNQDEP